MEQIEPQEKRQGPPKSADGYRNARAAMRRWVQWTMAGVLLGLLAGCEEHVIYPAGARQEIILRQNGLHQMRYEGEFRDFYVEFTEEARRIATAKGDTDPVTLESPEIYQANLLEKLDKRTKNRGLGQMQVEPLKHHNYRLAYEESFGASNYSNTMVVKPDASLIMLGTIGVGDDGMFRLDNESPLASELHEMEQARKDETTRPTAERFLALASTGVRGTLVVRTDGRVMEHDASVVTPLKDGLTEYRWEVTGDSIGKQKFVVVFGDDNQRAYLLNQARTAADCTELAGTKAHSSCLIKTAPPGSNCKELIGDNCKCGPLKIWSKNGKPLTTPWRYELHHPGGVKTGCTDADGMVPAETSTITGPCSVRLKGVCTAP